MSELRVKLKQAQTFSSRFQFLIRFYKEGLILDVGNIGGAYGKRKSHSNYLKFKKHLSNTSALYGFDLYHPPCESSHLYPFQTRGNLEQGLPYKTASFDTLYAGQVLEHISDPHCVLREFNRILKKGGVLILGVPNPYRIKRIARWIFKREETFGDPTHLLLYTPLSFKALLLWFDFKILCLTTDRKLGTIWPFKKAGLGAHILCCAVENKE